MQLFVASLLIRCYAKDMQLFGFVINFSTVIYLLIISILSYIIFLSVKQLRGLAGVAAERNKLTAIMESMGEGIIALDEKGIITQVNQACALLIETSEQMIRGKLLEDVITIFEKEHKITAREMLLLLQEKKETSIRWKELKVVTHLGKDRYIHLTVTPLRKSNDNVHEAILLMHDITDERELERMKLDFVSMAAHELRTPLTSLRGYLGILQKDLQSKLIAEDQTFLDRSIISANQLYSLVQNLLNVSRIEQGKFKLEIHQVALDQIVQTVIENLKQVALEHQISLSYQYTAQPLPKVEADPMRINEVLTNLIANAITYNHPGGYVKVTISQAEDTVVVSVHDNGQGIPVQSISRLFTKFYRVSSTLGSGAKGTGLGLYICKSVIDGHFGKIWVESVEGKGSIFSFSLPIKQPLLQQIEEDKRKPQGLYKLEEYEVDDPILTAKLPN